MLLFHCPGESLCGPIVYKSYRLASHLILPVTHLVLLTIITGAVLQQSQVGSTYTPRYVDV